MNKSFSCLLFFFFFLGEEESSCNKANKTRAELQLHNKACDKFWDLSQSQTKRSVYKGERFYWPVWFSSKMP